MHNLFRKKTISILMFMLIFGIGISILIVGVQFYFQKDIYEVIAEKYEEGPPQTGDNVFGFAWSENIGWISFNSSDCDTDGDGSFNDGVVGCPASSVDFYDYGVNIDNLTGTTSGYAWSSNVGWISFEENEATPDSHAFSSNCESQSDCNEASDHCTACYNHTDNLIYGWAKILSLGDDGWIKFNHSVSGNTIINTSANEIEGWAWNGRDNDVGIGWISMNCENEICVNSTTGIATSTDNNGISVNCIDNTCNGEPGVECRNQCKVCNNNKDRLCVNAGDCVVGPCDYNVYGVIAKVDMIPRAENLTAPNWGENEACKQNADYYPGGTGESLRALLKWKYVDSPGDTQSAYRVIARRGDNNAIVIKTGKCSAIGGNCRINPDCTNCYFPLYETDTNFDYNTSYEWSVEVWDTNGNNSGVINYDVISDTHNDDGVNTTFTTYEHKFPEPNFTWFPNNPSVNEEVMFMASSTSVCYSNGATINPECTGYIWDWSRISGSNISTDSPNPNNASTTIIKFIQAGQLIGIELKLEDSDGYSCSTSTINDKTKQNLPSWIEAK